MWPFRKLGGGLGSRVAVRTFLLFCLCSTAPVVLFAGLGYRLVTEELAELAQSRLNSASKRYGVLVYERLLETQTLLSELARMHSAGRSLSPEDSVFGSRVRIVSVTRSVEPAASVPPLLISTTKGETTVRLQVTEVHAGAVTRIVGELDPQYLWNDDVAEISGSTLCVLAADGVPLLCEPAAEGSDHVQGEWRLFLRPQFATDDWIIRARQPKELALQTARSFAVTWLFVAALAVAVALLLSSVLIRRSHRPLSVLAHAARRMSRGRFDAPIRIDTRDEYAGLGKVFNRMAANLRRQFRMLSAFSRVDQLILARPAIEPVVEALLPKILGMLRCETAAIVLIDPMSRLGRVFVVRRDDPRRLELTRAQIDARFLQEISPTGGTSSAPLSEAAPEALQACDAVAWTSAPVRVGGQIRGALLLGHASIRPRARRTEDYVSGLAQRLAVAIGNEDRERALLQQAYYDSLTGLPNRQLFRDRLERELARARRAGATVVLLFIDLDRFKNVNDSLGHSAGDDLLKTAATRLATTLRESDTLARIGGDEFTLICPEMTSQAAAAFTSRILEALEVPAEISGVSCVAPASIGVAIYPQDGTDAEMLIRNADTAMYRAKAAGGGTAVFFEEAMNERAVRRLRLEQRLREALERDQLMLFYQRKVRAHDGATVGAEALARWIDPQEGAISPAEFIAIAEECGMIGQLDRWAIRTACRQLRRWRSLALEIGHVAVNVSLRHLRDDTFADFLAASLRDYDLPPQSLQLEITESTLAEDPQQVARLLARIRELGVRIAIDDFGTGYSSMAVLQQMPIDILKIDRAFVAPCLHDASSGELLKALLLVARGLGKQVVAEGVETAGQAAYLRAHGCDVLQGFLFARPIPAEELEKDLAPERDQRRA
jgi:diguanylate cyclase (GGDEF)-like protein